MQRKGGQSGQAKSSAWMPATDDEIKEKYLERAIRELNALTRAVQACEACPRGNLMPVLGSVRIRMRDFEGPEEFLESLRAADIVRTPSSLLYVQALKFLQTKARPARASRREREGEGKVGEEGRAAGGSNL